MLEEEEELLESILEEELEELYSLELLDEEELLELLNGSYVPSLYKTTMNCRTLFLMSDISLVLFK